MVVYIYTYLHICGIEVQLHTLPSGSPAVPEPSWPRPKSAEWQQWAPNGIWIDYIYFTCIIYMYDIYIHIHIIYIYDIYMIYIYVYV